MRKKNRLTLSRLGPALLALLVVGCGAPAEPESSQEAKAIQQMLNRRADALNAGDLQGFLAPVTPKLREVEEPVARRLLALPVQDLRFDLDPPSVGGDFPMRGVSAKLNYRFEGTPESNRFSIPITYGFDGPEEEHFITEVSVDAEQMPPWLDEHASVTRTEHFLALHRPEAEGLQEVLEVAESARSDLQQSLPTDMDPLFLMVLAADDVDYQRVTGRDLLEQLPRVAQAITRFSITPESYQARYRHLVVNLDRLDREGTARQTFQHELAHLALASLTRPITPGWVTEGAAMYAADQRPDWTQRVTTGGFTSVSFVDLSASSQLGGEGPAGDGAGLEYAYAAGAAFYLIERFGEPAFWDFYRDFAAVPPGVIYESLPSDQPAPGKAHLAELTETTTVRLVQEHFGLSLDQLDQAVRSYIVAGSD